MWGQGPIYRKLSIPLAVLISVVGTLQTECVSRKGAPLEASNQRPASTTRSGALGSTTQNPPSDCPKFGKAPEPPVVWTKGEHIVILSWTASAPGDAKHSDADGYCVYRAEQKDDGSLVRVNSKAFRGTSCTDDRVPTGKTYYYKIKAVSRYGTPSDPTDFAPAPVLDPKPSTPSGNPPPVCRGSDSTQ